MSDLSETMFLISQAVKSNLPLGEAIRVSLPEEKSSVNRSLLRFAALLDEGVELPKAARQAKLPTRLATAIETAFASGGFSDYFMELAEAERSRFKMLSRLSSVIAYPVILLLIVLFLGLMCCFLVPMFETVHQDFDAELPALTELVFWTTRFVTQYGGAILLLAVVLLFAIKCLFPAFLFYIPGTRQILRTMTAQKILSQLRLSLLRRIPLSEALMLAGKNFSRNRTLRKHCRRASAEAEAGTPFSDIIAHYPLLFPRWLVPFVKTAEKNDSVPEVLKKEMVLLEEYGTGAAMMCGTLLVLSCYFFVISFAGLLVIALFLPLIKLITVLSG